MLARPSRAQAVVGVLLALLGFAAAVQVNEVDSNDDYSGTRREDLVQLLQTLSSAQERADRQVAELEQTRVELAESTDSRQAALDDAREQLESLQLLAGQRAATGPGVTISISDPDGSIAAATLLNAVQELRDAGAEAIEINNVARVVAQTWFGEGSAEADSALAVDGIPVEAPYSMEVIGNPDTLAEAVGFPGGLIDEVEALGGTVTVTPADALEIESSAIDRVDDFAEPAT
jgi:uncharacterized protein YlxW (UPF0749 family)